MVGRHPLEQGTVNHVALGTHALGGARQVEGAPLRREERRKRKEKRRKRRKRRKKRRRVVITREREIKSEGTRGDRWRN